MTLRKLTEADLPAVLAWRNALEVREAMFSSHKISETEHRVWFSILKSDPQQRWYIHQGENNIPDGVVYLTNYKAENKSSFWGFYTAIDAPAGTGIKLGFDALNEAFYILHLHKLNAEVLITNESSLHFHEKMGFTVEGRFRDFHFNGDKFIDVIRLGILESEWSKNKAKIENRIATFDAMDKTLSK
jgi:UDP-4-amino-4,6-dideoxy-N-acetyl-beta-L-altrosamine N-acetyltransferase